MMMMHAFLEFIILDTIQRVRLNVLKESDLKKYYIIRDVGVNSYLITILMIEYISCVTKFVPKNDKP